MEFNQRVRKLRPSPTLALNQKAKSLQAEGVSVVNLTAGEPDFRTPKRICEAAVRAIERGHTRYTASSGIVELKDAVRARIREVYGLSYERPQVLISCGAKQALFNLFLALLNEGDEVILFAPYWVSYVDMAVLAGGKPVSVHAAEKAGFVPDLTALERAITSRTRLIVLNSPCNPTGAVFPRTFLEGVGEILKKNPDVFVATDDIYGTLVFDGKPFESVAKIPGIPLERVVLLNGVSKSYAMTGWRIGYALAAKPLIEAMDVVQSNSTSNAPTISQWAAVEAVSGDQTDVEQMRKTFEQRRDRFFKRLIEIPSVTCVKPSGAFYYFPNFNAHLGKTTPKGKVLRTDVDLAAYFLSDHGVAAVPGSVFGSDGFLRISFAAADAELDEGLKRIEAGVKALN